MIVSLLCANTFFILWYHPFLCSSPPSERATLGKLKAPIWTMFSCSQRPATSCETSEKGKTTSKSRKAQATQVGSASSYCTTNFLSESQVVGSSRTRVHGDAGPRRRDESSCYHARSYCHLGQQHENIYIGLGRERTAKHSQFGRSHMSYDRYHVQTTLTTPVPRSYGSITV